MKCLFIDLASRVASVACVTEDSVLSAETVAGKVSDAELIPLVERVLKQADWEYGDLTQLACIIGPGGFTSLRVAVTFCNVLADQLSIPVSGIHLSDLYAARTNEPTNWLHSTKKQQLFVRGESYPEPTLITTEEIPSGPWVGELIEEHQQLLVTDAEPLTDTKEVLPAFLSTQTYEQKLLEPWYGRGW